MRRLVVFAAFLLLSLAIATGTVAQAACSDVVNQAIQQLSNNCGDLPRNSACYGYNHVVATFFDALTPDAFTHPNDRVDLAALQSITTSPLDVTTSQWGIAVIKAQANLPDALPGQAVTFLLLGDVHLETGVTQGSDMKPMQAVYFTTGIGDTRCNDAPESSLIIQGPQDITVNLSVNGANIQLGSTAIFRSTPNSTMECGVVDGAAHVGSAGQVIPAGFAARVPLDQNLSTNGDWGGNQPIQDQDAAALQVLREVPDGVLNYTPDVPTPAEVDMLAALDPDLVTALDPHVLRDLARTLIDEGATPFAVAQWDVPTTRAFVANNAGNLATPEAQATAEPVSADTVQTVLDALDAYLNGSG